MQLAGSLRQIEKLIVSHPLESNFRKLATSQTILAIRRHSPTSYFLATHKLKNVTFASCRTVGKTSLPVQLAKVAKSISIPVIGIGAGGDVDGQVLVIHDMLGMNNEFSPRFLRRYLNLYEEMTSAIGQYVKDVKSSDFPNANEQY